VRGPNDYEIGDEVEYVISGIAITSFNMIIRLILTLIFFFTKHEQRTSLRMHLDLE
jgi:hypothetical protein